MTAAVWTALALWVLVTISIVVAVFLIRLLLQLARVSAHLDITLAEVDRTLPPLAEQSRRTLESVEIASGQARILMAKLGTPLDSFAAVSKKTLPIFSPQVIAAIIGFIKVLRMVRKLFGSKH